MQLHTPILIVAGGRDDVTPLPLARRLFELLRCAAHVPDGSDALVLHEVTDKTHSMLRGVAEMRIVMEFFARHLAPAPGAWDRDPSLLRVDVGPDGELFVR
uniref:Peptidase S9 prolyl oligopeptidase catalytic domain-containing protein n=1 Tax=Calcidiscus leptoporus TaxID=127549 RepID=A0A7S0ITL5_9EUKA|mmetsp:Transcript_22320/g.51381  ORF Transcript_22320/g.51381 Transcript_22320/m.51381 type:complete len:101 (+) Transcript_22320:386-688(+)